MILVFSILITFIMVSIIIILLSTLQIKLEDIIISNDNKQKKLNYKYTIYFQLYLFNKLKWLGIRIDETKLKKLNTTFKKINIKQVKDTLPSKQEIKELFKKLQIEVSLFRLEMQIGTEDVMITSALVGGISALLGIGLSKVISKYEKKKYHYQIEPIYKNTNIVNLKLNCIIQVKLVHIIYIIYVLLKKRRVKKHERTSNRRSYDYGYE